MTRRRLLGERVAVKVKGCPTRDGVLVSGVKKPTKTIERFPVRFPNGDVRTYLGSQLFFRGSKAPLLEFIRVGDIIFTKSTLGVVRFIGLHEDFVGTIIVLEPIDPKLPSDPDVDSFRKVFPSANLSDNRAYIIIRRMEDILKILPPDTLLQQLSKIKDKYLAYVECSREKDRVFEEDMSKWAKKIAKLEQQKEDTIVEETSSDAQVSIASEDSNIKQILFQPGRLGIKAVWSTGEVEGVSPEGQAERLGVKAGWIMVKIDDEDYSEHRLDSRMAGDKEYTMTFQIPSTDPKPEPVPRRIEETAGELLTKETAKESYERKIHEFNEQIEDYQYTVEGLQKKNLKLEQELKELPKLRDKVGQLRNSRVVFRGQIKEVQKRLQKAKEKAELNEKKFKDSLLERKLADKNSPLQSPQNEEERNRGSKPFRRHNRKPSVTMPKPDSSNTVDLSGKPIPKIGDGSAQTVSLSNLHQQPTKRTNQKKNSGMTHRLRNSFFKKTAQRQPKRGG